MASHAFLLLLFALSVSCGTEGSKDPKGISRQNNRSVVASPPPRVREIRNIFQDAGSSIGAAIAEFAGVCQWGYNCGGKCSSFDDRTDRWIDDLDRACYIHDECLCKACTTSQRAQCDKDLANAAYDIWDEEDDCPWWNVLCTNSDLSVAAQNVFNAMDLVGSGVGGESDDPRCCFYEGSISQDTVVEYDYPDYEYDLNSEVIAVYDYQDYEYEYDLNSEDYGLPPIYFDPTFQALSPDNNYDSEYYAQPTTYFESEESSSTGVPYPSATASTPSKSTTMPEPPATARSSDQKSGTTTVEKTEEQLMDESSASKVHWMATLSLVAAAYITLW